MSFGVGVYQDVPYDPMYDYLPSGSVARTAAKNPISLFEPLPIKRVFDQ